MMFASTLLILISSVTCADENVVPAANAEGIYVGVGGGLTYNLAMTSLGNFDDRTDTHNYTTDFMSDTSTGYVVYA